VKDQIVVNTITDDYIQQRLKQAKPYTLVVLRPTAQYSEDGSQQIIWEHVRRNMALQAAGIMPIVCPVGSEDISGIGIFNVDPEQVRAIMADDPGVQTGIFTFEVHACRGFPGDALPRSSIE
jgi:hypothetical protein